MTWILKKEPKKLLQPKAIISCGDRGRIGGGGHGGWAAGRDQTWSSMQAGCWASDLRMTLQLEGQILPSKLKSASCGHSPSCLPAGTLLTAAPRTPQYLSPCLCGTGPVLLCPAGGGWTYLVRIHIIAVLAGQGPAHGQVDDIAHNGQREGRAHHVLPLGNHRQHGSGEPAKEPESRQGPEV